jgi:hypothetical protein
MQHRSTDLLPCTSWRELRNGPTRLLVLNKSRQHPSTDLKHFDIRLDHVQLAASVQPHDCRRRELTSLGDLSPSRPNEKFFSNITCANSNFGSVLPFLYVPSRSCMNLNSLLSPSPILLSLAVSTSSLPFPLEVNALSLTSESSLNFCSAGHCSDISFARASLLSSGCESARQSGHVHVKDQVRLKDT